jgi:hypothetical protein
MAMTKREAAERVITLLTQQDMDGYALASKTGIPANTLGEVVDVLRRQGLLRVNSTHCSAEFDFRAWYQAGPAMLSATNAARTIEGLATLT